jgi:hypothetical protein
MQSNVQTGMVLVNLMCNYSMASGQRVSNATLKSKADEALNYDFFF